MPGRHTWACSPSLVAVGCVSGSLACYVTVLFTVTSLASQNSLYVVYKSPVSNLRFAYLLSPSVTCLLVLWRVFFKEQKCLILKSFSSIFSFLECAFGIVSKKPWPNPRSQRSFSHVSRWEFVVSGFTPGSVIRSELIFYVIQSIDQSLLLWNIDIHVLEHHLLKRPFRDRIAFAHLLKMSCPCLSRPPRRCSLSHWSVGASRSSPHTVFITVVSSVEVRCYFAHSRSFVLYFYRNLRISLLLSPKKKKKSPLGLQLELC